MADSGFEVWRGGISSDYVRHEPDPHVIITTGKSRLRYPNNDGVQIALRIASKGGGKTRVFLWIDPLEFDSVARAMFEASPLFALATFQKMEKHLKWHTPKQKRERRRSTVKRKSTI
jgi:hypothetical protein